jgi:hypothetical protein
LESSISHAKGTLSQPDFLNGRLSSSRADNGRAATRLEIDLTHGVVDIVVIEWSDRLKTKDPDR